MLAGNRYYENPVGCGGPDRRRASTTDRVVALQRMVDVKFPNFRLHETQAKLSIILAVIGLASLGILGVFVFKNFRMESNVILVGTQGTFGKIRQPGVFGFTALTLVVAAIGALLGFNSLGQKRNKKQSFSWIGMFAGATIAALAVVFFIAWTSLKEVVL